MGGGIDPPGANAKLIGRLTLGQPVSEAEVDRLPDPDLFRDAYLLSSRGTFSPRDLDEMDVELLALMQRFWTAKRG